MSFSAACSSTNEYPYYYDVAEICLYQSQRTDYIEFEFAKDDSLNGRLVVLVGSVNFFITDYYGQRVKDAGRIEEGQDYKFSIRAEQTGIRYKCWFQRATDFTRAKFYCNFTGHGSLYPLAAKSTSTYETINSLETYTNDEHGYTILYPSEWIVSDAGKYFDGASGIIIHTNNFDGSIGILVHDNETLIPFLVDMHSNVAGYVLTPRYLKMNTLELAYCTIESRGTIFHHKVVIISTPKQIYEIVSSEYVVNGYCIYSETIDTMIYSFTVNE